LTIGTKLHQCLTDCEGVVADLKSFALETENKQSKQTYTQLAQNMEDITNQLRSQVNSAEQQEPQYKVFSQNLQQGNQQQNKQ